jgi:hypothetical protein
VKNIIKSISVSVVFTGVLLVFASSSNASLQGSVAPCAAACEQRWTRPFHECNQILECERYVKREYIMCMQECVAPPSVDAGADAQKY